MMHPVKIFSSNPGRSEGFVIGRRQLHFTLLELLIVLVIVSAGLALVGPRVGRLPSRLVVRNAVAGLETAFSEAGMRARATGRPVTLILQPQANRIILRDRNAEEPVLPDDPLRNQNQLTSFSTEVADTLNLSYDLDEEIQWGEGMYAFRNDQYFYFAFFPDGTSVGPAIDFTIRDISFRLKVDRLTGRMRVIDLSE